MFSWVNNSTAAVRHSVSHTLTGDSRTPIPGVCCLSSPGAKEGGEHLRCRLATWWVSRTRLIERTGPKLLNSLRRAPRSQCLLNGPA